MPITAQERTLLPEGMYPAHFAGWEEANDGQYGPGVKLIWTLDEVNDDAGKPQEKWQFVSQKLTPRSNLWAFLKTMGTEPTLGHTYELDELLDPFVGKSVNLGIKHVDGPQGETDRIMDVYPAQAKAPTAAPARAAASPPGVRNGAAPAQPQQEENPQLGPCFICDEQGTQFDGKGREVCDRHATVQ